MHLNIRDLFCNREISLRSGPRSISGKVQDTMSLLCYNIKYAPIYLLLLLLMHSLVLIIYLPVQARTDEIDSGEPYTCLFYTEIKTLSLQLLWEAFKL